MENNIDKLIDVIRDYQLLVLKKRRIKILHRELKQEKINRFSLERQIEKEHQDIINLEKFSIRFFFNTILIDNETQLQKEKQEYLAAVFAYNESVKLVQLLEYELSILEKSVLDESVLLKAMNTALEYFDDEVLISNSVLLHELKNTNLEIKKLIRLVVETEEALEALSSVRSIFLEVISALNKASESENWGKFYHEIQASKKMQQENIDKAHSYIPIIKKLFYLLKNELQDVEDYQVYFKRSEVLIRGFNTEYYQDLITDWVNDSNLIETLSTTMSSHTLMIKLKESLEKLSANCEDELPILIDKRMQLIEKISSENREY